ncbi:hypothetical protein NL676_019984 [Syzygium grande]|nr:hypothetical protein NL676_019984 [Syzygium grande]
MAVVPPSPVLLLCLRLPPPPPPTRCRRSCFSGSHVSIGKPSMPPVPSAALAQTMGKGSADHLAFSIDSESNPLIGNKETDEDKVSYSDPISGYTVVNFQGLYENEQGVLREFFEPIPRSILGVARIFSAIFSTRGPLAPPSMPPPPAIPPPPAPMALPPPQEGSSVGSNEV